MIKRRPTRQIRIGEVTIGGNAPIRVQSMTKTDTEDVEATLSQIKELKEAGCEIIRVAIPRRETLRAFEKVVIKSPLPVIADVHFDWKIAVGAIERGAAGLRINPGNIGDKKKIEAIVKRAQDYRIPIRIGVNSGSLEKDLLRKYGHPTAEALVESALRHVKFMESLGFRDLKISLKASDVLTTVEAYRKISSLLDYPLHVGLTEAGTLLSGSVRSAVAVGILLAEGIGDTVRISLAAPPIYEVKVAWEILKSLGIRKRGVELIVCPTCGRLQVDLLPIVAEIERRLSVVKEPIKVAVMGCVVNGPGEAREADIGLACGRGVGVIFEKGKIVERVEEKKMVDIFVKRVFNLLKKKEDF